MVHGAALPSDLVMEFLTEAHAALARPHMQGIQRRIAVLKETADSYASTQPNAFLSSGI